MTSPAVYSIVSEMSQTTKAISSSLRAAEVIWGQNAVRSSLRAVAEVVRTQDAVRSSFRAAELRAAEIVRTQDAVRSSFRAAELRAAEIVRTQDAVRSSFCASKMNRLSRDVTTLTKASRLDFSTSRLIGKPTQHHDASFKTRAYRPAIKTKLANTTNETADHDNYPELIHYVPNGRRTTGLLITPDSGNTLSIQVGFSVSLGSIPIPQAIEAVNPEVTSDPRYWRIFVTLEQHLRSFVKRSLEKSVGNNWIRQRVPEDVRKNWTTRQNEDRVLRKPIYELIQYADFMDLEKIIIRKDNWQEVFKHVFRNRDDIRVTFARLHPIRNAIAHGRPLDSDDTLSLINEATRIFHSLRLKELH